MNRTLKRVLGLTGSVALGIAGAVTFASAAQAHHVTVDGVAKCLPDGSGWVVNWEATDWEGKPADIGAGFVTGYTINAGEVAGDLFVADPDPVLPEFGSETPLTGTQTLSLDEATASLSLSGEWPNQQTNTTEPRVIPQPEGGCGDEEPTEPTYGLDPAVNCVGIGIEAYNENPEDLYEFTFVSSDGEEYSETPEIGDVFSAFFLIEDPEAGLSVDVFVDDELVDTVEWYDNELCGYIDVEADCEGLNFTLSVPEDGDSTKFILWTSYSDEPEEITVEPGSSETREFKAVDGVLWVDYYIETRKDGTEGGVEWIPCDEESPSPSDTPSAQPQLPTTGSSMTIMIGSAAALIVAAAAIFLIMRRRRAAQDW